MDLLETVVTALMSTTVLIIIIFGIKLIWFIIKKIYRGKKRKTIVEKTIIEKTKEKERREKIKLNTHNKWEKLKPLMVFLIVILFLGLIIFIVWLFGNKDESSNKYFRESKIYKDYQKI